MTSPQHHPMSILVAGAGIAGLGAALALSGEDRTVTLVDRDPPPPDTSIENAFRTWERRGVGQLRHSHVFLGRLTTLIRERYPRLLEELLEAGARIFTFQDALPPPLRDCYVAEPGDADLAILFSRRTTLELVMRRYVAGLPGVTFANETGVRGLVAHREGVLHIDGLKVSHGDTSEELRADITIDATGRNTQFPEWLREAGVNISEEKSPTGIVYFTRHYRLRDGRDEPSRNGPPGAGDLGYIKYGVFAADNRHFSITLATPEIETALRLAIVRPEIFDSICALIPGCARWTDTERAEPVSPVYAMGNMISLWRSTLKDGEPQALNFFAIGDAAVRASPLYGRGCSAGVAHAHIVRAAIDASDDPRKRALFFERETRKELRPFYDAMRKQDLQAIRRAEHERDPAYKPKLRARIVKSFIEDAITPSTRGDLAVLRASSRAFHMIDDPMAWLMRPAILTRMLKMWATPTSRKLAANLYPPKLGPERREMLARIGLAA